MHILYFHIALVLMLTASLTSCATLSKQQCETGQWRQIGQKDGEQGHELEHFKHHRKACKDHGIKPDHHAYLQGREIGLRSFCTIETQFKRGLSGKEYKHVCEKFNEAALRHAYQKGQALNEVQTALFKAREQLNEVEMKSLNRNISRAEEQRLSEEQIRLEQEIERLERQEQTLTGPY